MRNRIRKKNIAPYREKITIRIAVLIKCMQKGVAKYDFMKYLTESFFRYFKYSFVYF